MPEIAGFRWISLDSCSSRDMVHILMLPSGRLLRHYRMLRGWTQRDLGDASGLSESYISELERGVKDGGPRGWKRLADALDVSIVDLMPSEEKVG